MRAIERMTMDDVLIEIYIQDPEHYSYSEAAHMALELDKEAAVVLAADCLDFERAVKAAREIE